MGRGVGARAHHSQSGTRTWRLEASRSSAFRRLVVAAAAVAAAGRPDRRGGGAARPRDPRVRGFGFWREPPGDARSRLTPPPAAHARAPPPAGRARWVGWEPLRGRGHVRASGDWGQRSGVTLGQWVGRGRERARTLGVASSGFLGASSRGSRRGGGSGSEAAPLSGNFLQHGGNTSGPCVGPLPVSGPWSFAGRPGSHFTAPAVFPAVVLVFGEVSPGADVGAPGPCPEQGWFLP